MGTKKLKPVIEQGTEAVRKADSALKVLIGLAVTTLAVALLTLAAVLVRRPHAA